MSETQISQEDEEFLAALSDIDNEKTRNIIMAYIKNNFIKKAEFEKELVLISGLLGTESNLNKLQSDVVLSAIEKIFKNHIDVYKYQMQSRLVQIAQQYGSGLEYIGLDLLKELELTE